MVSGQEGLVMCHFFFFQAEDGIRDGHVTGVQTCALPIFGAARDLDVVPVGRVAIVRALQVDVTADGAKVLLVEGQIGGAADYVSPRSDAFGTVDGHVAGSPKNADRDGAGGSGKHYSDSAGAAGQLDRTESELAKVCGEL